jgi:hypothetical protein
MKVRVCAHGVEFHDLELGVSFDVALIAFDPRAGRWIELRAGRETVTIRITPGGRLRVQKPQRSSPTSSVGLPVAR